jgi:hypothetical protein
MKMPLVNKESGFFSYSIVLFAEKAHKARTRNSVLEKLDGYWHC